jgi:predicted transcriptional regulator
LPESTERKKRDHGPTWKHARRLYLKYPLLQAADIARVLGVTRQAVCKYVRELNEERETLYEKALIELKRKEGL